MRILYVEDHSANLFLVQRVARMGNHEVINYTDGESALENFAKDNPDLVLMDVQLPGKLTGLDVVKELRARGHKTPIIAVTAYAMMGDRERCLSVGCDGYIAKPLPVAELVELIKQHEKGAGEAASAPAATAEVKAEPAATATSDAKPPAPETPTPVTGTVAETPAVQSVADATEPSPPVTAVEEETSPAPPPVPVVQEQKPGEGDAENVDLKKIETL
jgi:CheY-like chemotaxis protein